MILPRKKPKTTGEQPEGSYDGLEIRPLGLADHWRAAGHMFKNYPGVDTNFDQMLGKIRRPFLRWLGMPLYFRFLNEGWGLWLREGAKPPQLAGQLFMQYRKMVAHINDIEVYKAFQGRRL